MFSFKFTFISPRPSQVNAVRQRMHITNVEILLDNTLFFITEHYDMFRPRENIIYQSVHEPWSLRYKLFLYDIFSY